FTDSHQSLPFEATDHEISVVLALMPTHQTKFQERSRKCKTGDPTPQEEIPSLIVQPK
ncbi:hypothetical protein MRX96_045659, partial [Rhipicephalus microplus]